MEPKKKMHVKMMHKLSASGTRSVLEGEDKGDADEPGTDGKDAKNGVRVSLARSSLPLCSKPGVEEEEIGPLHILTDVRESTFSNGVVETGDALGFFHHPDNFAGKHWRFMRSFGLATRGTR